MKVRSQALFQILFLLVFCFLTISFLDAQNGGSYPSIGTLFMSPNSGFQLSDGVTTTYIRNGSVVIMGAEPNSPALAAGLRGGDVLISANGKRICRAEDPLRLISANGVGAEVAIAYVRDGHILNTKVRVANRLDFDPGFLEGNAASPLIDAAWERNDVKGAIRECERLRNPNPYFVNGACGLAYYYRYHMKQGEAVFSAAEATCPMCANAFAQHAIGRQRIGQDYLQQWGTAEKLMQGFRNAQEQAFAAMDANITAEMKDLAEKGQAREALDRYTSFANEESECRDTPPSQDLAELVANLTLRDNPALQASQAARRKAEAARSLRKVATNGGDLTKAYRQMNAAIWLAPWWAAAYSDAANMLETLGLPKDSLALANRALTLPRAKADAVELSTAASNEPAMDVNANPEKVLQSCIVGLASADAGSAEEHQLKRRCVLAAQKMNPAPTVSEEAERHLARGQAGMEIGSSPAEFNDAAAEFNQAVRLAPWWPDAYRGLATALDKSGSYQGAIDAYQFYLLAAPGAPDAKDIHSKIYKLEFAAEREQKQAIEKSLAQKQQAARVLSLQGIWREKDSGMVWQASLQNGMLVAHKRGYAQDGWLYQGEFTFKASLSGNELSGTFMQPQSTESKSSCDVTASEQPLTGTISDDARTITLRYQSPVYMSDFVRATLLTNARCIRVQKMRDDVKIVVIEKQ